MRVIDEDGGEAPLTRRAAAGMVADALAELAAPAARRRPTPPRRARSCARRPPTCRPPRRRDARDRARSVGARRGRADRRRLLRRGQGAGHAPRATDDLAARDRPADPPLGRGRGLEHGQDRGRDPQGVPVAAGSTRARGHADRARERARAALGTAYVPIETVQDIVQEELVLAGHMRVAERYIVYRAERAMLRARRRSSRPRRSRSRCSRPTAPSAWTGADLRERIAFASIGLDLELDGRARARAAPLDPARDRRADLPRLVVLNAKALMERDAEYSRFAGRILLTYVYEETLGWDIVRDGVGALKGSTSAASRGASPRRRRSAASTRALLDVRPRPARRRARPDRRPRLRLPRPADALRPLPADRQDRRAAAPDRGAAALLAARLDGRLPRRERGDRDARTLDLYTVYSQRRFCSSTPTLFNAGTLHSQLSSCYLYYVDDTLTSIVGRGIAENAMCSKWAGGLGGSWTAVRGTGAHIEATNGEIAGRHPVPEAPQRPARRRQPGRQARRAPAAPTSRSGTTTSASSSSCAATPATTAAARTT